MPQARQLVLGLLTAISLAVAGDAYALDPLCGQTLTADLTLTGDVDCTGFTGNALTVGAHNVTIDGNGYKLIAPDSARAISAVGYNDLTIRDVELIGWCAGYGLYFDNGARLTVERVVADGRYTGVYVSRGVGVTLRDISATGSSYAGMQLVTITQPLVIEGVRLTNNPRGLYLSGVTGPLTLGATALPDLRGNDTSVELAANVVNVTFEDLVLDGKDNGVLATAATNTDLTFRRLDVSATTGTGNGVYLGGARHRLEQVTANRRSYGIQTSGVTNLALHDIRAVGSVNAAIYLVNTTAPLALSQLRLTGGNYGLYLSTYVAPVASPLRITPWDALAGTGVVADLSGNECPILLQNVQNAEVSGTSAASLMRLDGLNWGVYALGASNANLSFRHLDVSGKVGNGTGLYLQGVNLVAEDITADLRVTGVEVTSSTNLTLRDVRSDNTQTYGVTLSATTLPLTLERLRLTNGGTGLRIAGLAAPAATPFVLGAWSAGSGGAIESLAGHDTSLALDNVQYVRVQGLTLDGRSSGLYAYPNDANRGIEVVDVDASHTTATGWGIIMAGPDHKLTRTRTDRRSIGLYLIRTGGVALTDVVASRCSTGLTFYGFTTSHAAPVLSGVTLTKNSRALSLEYMNRAFSIDGDDADLDISDSIAGVTLTNSSLVTLRDLALPSTWGTALDARTNTSQLTLINVDASGAGAGTGVEINGGAGHVLTNVKAWHRSVGVYLEATSGAAITALSARHNASYGLRLGGSKPSSGHAAPTFAGLDLRDNKVGLYFTSWEVPLTFDGASPTLGLDVSGSDTGLDISYSNDLTFANLTLDNPVAGVNAPTRNHRMSFTDVDVSGPGGGYGMQLGTSSYRTTGQTLRRVTANNRSTGVSIDAIDGLVIDELTATDCSYAGLQLYRLRQADGLSLRRLSLGHNASGLRMDDVDGTSATPVVIDAFDGTSGAIADLLGCDSSVVVQNSASVRFSGFAADGVEYGIYAYSGGNSAITFRDLDVSGTQARGYGLYLYGNDHVVEDVDANRRAYGVFATNGANLTFDTLRADACGTALQVQTSSAPITLTDLSLTNSGYGLYLSAITGGVDVGPAAITSVAGTNRAIYLNVTPNARVHDLSLAGQVRDIAIYTTNCNNLVAEDLEVSGRGQGYGLYIQGGTSPIVRRVTAHQRDIGAYLVSVTAPTVQALSAHQARTHGLYLQQDTLPFTLADLDLQDNATGLTITTVYGTGPIVLGPSHLDSLAGSATAIALSSATGVTVDAAALGLVAGGTGYYNSPRLLAGALGPDPDCGRALDGVTPPTGAALTLNAATKTYTLVADLDCTRTLGSALDVTADGVTLDGAGHAILAPHVSQAVRVYGRTGTTLRALDLSGTYGSGAGVLLDGGSTNTLEDLIADDRYRGVHATNTAALVVRGLTARRSVVAGLQLGTLTGALTLEALTLTDGAANGLYLAGYDGDPLDLGASLTLDGSVLSDVRGNDISVQLAANVSDVVVAGTALSPLVLDGYELGLNVSASSAARVTARHLDASGRTYGDGLELLGTGHVVEDVFVRDRQNGLELTQPTALTLTRVTVSDASTRAVFLDRPTLPLSLSALSLTDSAIGLDVAGLNGPSAASPFLLDPAALTDLSGDLTGLRFASSSYVRVAGSATTRLSLPNRDAGISVGTSSHTFTIHKIDASSRYGLGTGVNLNGNDHTLSDLITRRHYTGVRLASGSNLALSGLVADLNYYNGLELQSLGLPLALSGLSLTRNYYGLRVTSFAPSTRFTFDTATLTDLSGNGYTPIIVTASSNLGFDDLTLDPAAAYGLHAWEANNSNLLIRDVVASGRFHTGYGLYLYGPNHQLERVTADHRAYGVHVGGASGLVVRTLHIDGATNGSSNSTALAVTGLPAELTDLHLTRSGFGLDLSGVAAPSATPFSLGPAQLADLSGNYNSIRLSNTQNVALTDLTLDGYAYGLDANAATNQNLRLTRVDASGLVPGVGFGLYLAGPGHTITDVTGNDRTWGLLLNTSNGFSVDGLTARYCTSGGLYVSGQTPAFTAPTLRDLTLTDNTTALYLTGWTRPHVFDGDPTLPTPLGLTFANNRTDIALVTACTGLTFRNLALGAAATSIVLDNSAHSGLVFEDLDLSGPRAGATGTGLKLYGANHVVRDVQIDGRTYGIDATGTSNLTVIDLVTTHTYYGLWLHNLTALQTAPTLQRLSLTDGNYGFLLDAIAKPLVLDGDDLDLDVSGSNIGVYFNQTTNVTVRDLDLRGARDTGLYAQGTGNTGGTYEDLDVSGAGRGTGLIIGGANNTVRRVVANDRVNGVSADGGLTGFTLDGLVARRAQTAALQLKNATAPTLRDLHLTDNTTGLYLDTVTGPLVLDAVALPEIARNHTHLAFNNYVSNVTVRGLTLPSSTTGVAASARYNRDLVFEDLDVSGYCRGNGLTIAGKNVLVDGVVAGRRATGIYASTGDFLTIRDSVVGANTTGIDAASGSFLLDTAVVTDVTNTAARFKVGVTITNYNIAVGDTVRITLGTGPEDRVISAISGQFLTLATALSAVPVVGNTVRALDVGSPRLVIESSDICANTTGMTTLAGPSVTATTNYWRASSGPTHASNPGGTGDKVTGTGTVSLTPFTPVPTDKANDYCNQFPVANAGPAQTVCEGDTIALTGTASYDPDVEPLTYGWTQTAGQAVTVTEADEAVAHFVAPPPAPGQTGSFQTLGFALEVRDDVVGRTATTSVVVEVGNKFPTASAGADQSTLEGASVGLEGAGTDPEASALTYLWTQTGGPSVTLSDDTVGAPSFVAPDITGGAPGEVTLTFELAVTDVAPAGYCGGDRTHRDVVAVVVANAVRPPVADAGPDAGATEGDTVALNGGASSDPDGDPLSYQWTQVSGPSVSLDDATAATPSFIAPSPPPGEDIILIFELSVDDGYGGVDVDTVTLTIASVCVVTGDDTDCDGVDDDCDGVDDDGFTTATEACVVPGGCAGVITYGCVEGALVLTAPCALAGPPTDSCDGVDSDCDGLTDEDFAAVEVACGEDACAVGSGLTTCVDGVAGDTCDPLWAGIPDTTCSDGSTGSQVVYVIATDAAGAPVGTVRCWQDLDAPGAPVTCETRPGTREAIVHPELWCEGVTP